MFWSHFSFIVFSWLMPYLDLKMPKTVDIKTYLVESRKMGDLEEEERVSLELKAMLQVILMKDNPDKLKYRCLVRKIISHLNGVIKSYSAAKMNKLVGMYSFARLYSLAFEDGSFDEVIRENETYALNYEAYSIKAQKMYKA